ncbi:MAG: DUF2341 domain-containing protein, partial [Patescibacteria group bacterium]
MIYSYQKGIVLLSKLFKKFRFFYLIHIKHDKSFRIIYSGWYAKEIPIQNLSDSGWKIKKIPAQGWFASGEKKENIKLNFGFIFLNLNNFLIKIKNQIGNLFDKYFSIIKNSKNIIFEFLLKSFNKIKNIKFNFSIARLEIKKYFLFIFSACSAVKLFLGKIRNSKKIIIASVNKNQKIHLAQNKKILSKQKKNIFDDLQKQFQHKNIFAKVNIFQNLKLKNIFKFWTEKETSKNLFIQRIKQIRKPKLIATMAALVVFVLISQLIWPAWQGWAFVQEKKWTTAGELTSGTLNDIDSTAQEGSLMINSPSNTWTQDDWVGGEGEESWSETNKYYSGTNVDTSDANKVKINLPTAWYNDSWGYRKEITLTENSARDLTNYQLKVRLTSDNFDFSKTKTNGEDLRFIDSDGHTELKYWIESWNQTNITDFTRTSNGATCSGGSYCAYAIDGLHNNSYQWYIQAAQNEDLSPMGTIDLGQTRTVNQVKVQLYNGDARSYYNYKVAVSGNNTDWTTWFDGTGSGVNYTGLQTINHDAADIRYIKVWISGSTTDTYGHVTEVYAYNTTTPNYSDIWVKIPTLGASSSKLLYMYYGNTGAIAASSAADTFIFADTFDGATINTDRWTEYDTGGNYLTQNDKILLSGGSGTWGQVGLVSKTNLSRPFVAEVKLTPKTSVSKSFMIGIHDQTASSHYNNLIYSEYFISGGTFNYYQDGSGAALPAYNWAINQQYRLKWVVHPTTYGRTKGCTYYLSSDNGETWSMLFDSYNSVEDNVRLGFDDLDGIFELDDWIVHGFAAKDATYSFDGEREKPTGSYTGSLISSAYETGTGINYGEFSSTVTEPSGTLSRFQLRTADTLDALSSTNWLGPDGDTGTYYQSTTSTAIYIGLDNKKYIQYKIFLSTDSLDYTPQVNDVSLTYTKASPGDLTPVFSQTDWTGGANQSDFTDTSKFKESSNVVYTESGQVGLSKPEETITENFSSTTKRDATQTTADWNSGTDELTLKKTITPRILNIYDTPGTAYDVAVSGNYAYVADYNQGLEVFDISTPSTPILKSRLASITNAYGVTLSGNYAYVAGNDWGLWIVDISNPLSPTLIKRYYPWANNTLKVDVLGNYAYIAHGGEGLRIVNITDKSNPSETGFYDTTGSCYDVKIRQVGGNIYAYVADGAPGLLIFDVTNPASPVLLDTLDTDNARDVVVDGDYAYVSDGNYFRILDVSTPSDIKEKSIIDTLDGAEGIYLSGNRIYIASHINGLQIIDVTDKSNPSKIAMVDTPQYVADTNNSAYQVAVSGNYAYVANGYTNGLVIIDVSEPFSPNSSASEGLKTLSDSQGVYVSGNYAYMAEGYQGLYIYDITGSTPSYVGSYDTPGYARDVVVSGDYAYVADSDWGLQIINISIPSAPSFVSWYNTPGTAYQVVVDGDYAYVIDATTLQIINISNKASLTLTGSYNCPDAAYGLDKVGNYVYVTGYGQNPSFSAVNVTNPASPTLAGSYNGSEYGNQAYDVKVKTVGASTYAFLASYNYGLQVLNITNLGSISRTTYLYSAETTYSVRIFLSGNYAYIANERGGLDVVDISNPAAINRQQKIDAPDYVMDVMVDGNYAYMAARSSGLQKVDITRPASLSSTPTVDYGREVFVSGNYAYMAEETNSSLSIFDITDKTAPVFLSNKDLAGTYCNDVKVVGNYAYVSCYDAGLYIIDVSDPANPVYQGVYNTPSYAYEVIVDGSYAYVADYATLQIINISVPTAPTLTGSYNCSDYAYYLDKVGDYVYITSYNQNPNLTIVNVSNPASPTLAGSLYQNDRQLNGIKVSGSYAYVAYATASSGVAIYNISNPASISKIGQWGLNDSQNSGSFITYNSNKVYLSSGTGGLHVIDVTTPASPTYLNTFDTPNTVRGSFISGNYLYFEDYPAGLKILDISHTIGGLSLKGSLDTPGNSYRLDKLGDYAYVADYSSDLRIINVSNPASPSATGNISLTGNSLDVKAKVQGSKTYAYVGTDQLGLQVVDATTPASPTIASSVNIGSNINGIELSGNYAYLASDTGGLNIVAISGTNGSDVSQESSDNVDFPYKKSIALTGAGDASTNYQIMVKVGYNSTATGVNLTCSGNCQADFDDIRFYDNDGITPLDYFRESYALGDKATFWVEVKDSLSSGQNPTIYMYYGDSDASTTSSGANTFPLFFDDFTGTTIDAGKWVETDTSSKISQSDKIVVTGGAGWGNTSLYSVSDFARADNVELLFDYKPTGGTSVMFGWKDSTSGKSYTDLIYSFYDTSDTSRIYEDNNDRGQFSGGWIANNTYKVRMPLKTGGGAKYMRSTDGGRNWVLNYDSSYSTEATEKIGFINSDAAYEIDNAFIRKSVTADPKINNYIYNAGGSDLTEQASGNGDFPYKKDISLIGAGNAGTNYRIQVNVSYASKIGANLSCSSHCQTDFDDIRFYDDDGITELDHWRSTYVDSDQATFYVQVQDSMSEGYNPTIYMYYGDGDASSASSLLNTYDVIREINTGQPLIGSWHFDENTLTTAADSSGNSSTGTLTSGPTWTTGKYGYGVNLDATNDYVNVATSSITATAGSVSLWIQPSWNGNDNTKRGIWNHRNGCTGAWLGLYKDTDNYIKFHPGESTAKVDVSSWTAGTWHFITFTWDNATGSKIYVDGEAAISYNGALGIGSLTTCVQQQIGGYVEYTAYPFNGIIDEVNLFNRVLTTDEITDLYGNYGWTLSSYLGRLLVREYPFTSTVEPIVSNIISTFTPTIISSFDTPGNAWDVRVKTIGDTTYAFVADLSGGGLRIINVTDPANPVEVSFIGAGNSFRAVDVSSSGNYVYLANDGNDLYIYDITNIAAPFFIGNYSIINNEAYDIQVIGNYVYLANRQGGFYIINVADPYRPAMVSCYDTSDYVWGLIVEGTYAYITDYTSGLKIIDLGNLSPPTQVSTTMAVGVSNAQDVAISGNYAYVAEYSWGLIVVDVSSTSTPSIVGSAQSFGNPYAIAVDGDYAYVASQNRGLEIFDISDPTAPVLTKSYTWPGSGSVYDIKVVGNYAYLANYTYGIKIIDITDKSNPSLISTAGVNGSASGIDVQGNYAYVTDYGAYINIFDISNKASPQWISSYNITGAQGLVWRIAVSGDYAYVADKGYNLYIFNIADPYNIALVGTLDYDISGQSDRGALNLFVSGTRVYIADYTRGLQVIDVSDPTAPYILSCIDRIKDNQLWAGVYFGGVISVTVSGHYAYLIDTLRGLWVVDLNLLSQTPVVNTASGGYVQDIEVQGDYAYVLANSSPGSGSTAFSVLSIFDTSTSPATLKSRIKIYDALGITVSGNYIYVANFGRGLLIIDASNKSSPQGVGIYDSTGSTYDVAVSGNYAYLADYSGGFKVIDITTKTNPVYKTVVNTGVATQRVQVKGNYAYVTDATTGFHIINITTPTSPSEIGSTLPVSAHYDFFVEGNYVYVADNTAGLSIYNISNPAAPYLVGSYDTMGNAYDVKVSGGYAYISDWGGGLLILDVSTPASPIYIGNYISKSATYRLFVKRNRIYLATQYHGVEVLNLKTQNSNVVSIGIDTLAAPILKGSLTATDTEPTGTSITYYLSVDNGTTWEAITPDGSEYTFTAYGSDLKWKAVMTTDDSTITPTISQVVIWASTGMSNTGYLISSVFQQTSPNFAWETIEWTDNEIQTTRVKVRTDATADMATATAWTTCPYAVNDGDLIDLSSVSSTQPYIQYRLEFATSDIDETPILDDIDITSAVYGTATFDYNQTNPVGWYHIDWVNSGGTDTAVKVRTKEADTQEGLDGDTWSDWVTTSGQDIREMASPTKWIRLEVQIESRKNNVSPILESLSIFYAVNVTPTVSEISAQENENGVVQISYTVLDEDSDSVSTTFQYWDGDSWEACDTTTGEGSHDVTPGVQTELTGTWNVKTDYNNQYLANSRIKIIIDDSSPYLNLGEDQSNTFVIDTKKPTTPTISINSGAAITNSLFVTLTPSCVDDSDLKVQFSNDDSTYGTVTNVDGVVTNSGEWEVKSIGKSWIMKAVDGSTRTAWFKCKDIYGNQSDTGGSATINYDTSLPGVVTNVSIADASNEYVERYALTIMWDALSVEDNPDFSAYSIERSTDGVTYSPAASISDITTSVYTNIGLSKTITYFYRIKTKDTADNYSLPSSVVSYQPASEDDIPPALTGGSPVATSHEDYALFTWATDEPSDSHVEYGIVSGTYTSMQGNDTQTLTHSVQVYGLNPLTTYYYRIRSKDASGNPLISSEYSFIYWPPELDDIPSISGEQAQSPSSVGTEVTITWITDKYTTSQVYYGSTQTGTCGELDSHTTEDTTLNKSHTVQLRDLPYATTYYYCTRSKDTYDHVTWGTMRNFTTEEEPSPTDTTAPVISEINSYPTETLCTIIWETDDSATSQVEYGSTTDYGTSSTLDSLLTTQHVVRLTGLTTEQVYHYRIKSKNIANLETTSQDYTFTPQYVSQEIKVISSGGGAAAVPTKDTTPPVISNLSVSSITDTGAVVSWVTNEDATSLIDYGLSSSYSEAKHASLTDFTVSHQTILSNLTKNTVYHYQVLSQDASGNLAQSADATFTTLSAPGETTPTPETTPETPATPETPVEPTPIETIPTPITAVDQSFVTAMEAARQISTQVTGPVLETTFQNFLNTLKDITPGLSLEAAPEIEISATDAIIKWKTNKRSNSQIAFAKVVDYDDTKSEPYSQIVGQSNEKELNHNVKIINLTPSTDYYFQIRSKSIIGSEAKSKRYTFTTASQMPEVLNFSIKNISERAATFVWQTNIPTDSQVKYIPYRNNQLAPGEAQTVTKSDFNVAHEIAVKNLEPGTTFNVSLEGKDLQGNNYSFLIPNFTTTKDKNAPIISQIRTSIALSSRGDEVQTIITWNTDEP